MVAVRSVSAAHERTLITRCDREVVHGGKDGAEAAKLATEKLLQQIRLNTDSPVVVCIAPPARLWRRLLGVHRRPVVAHVFRY